MARPRSCGWPRPPVADLLPCVVTLAVGYRAEGRLLAGRRRFREARVGMLGTAAVATLVFAALTTLLD